MMWTVIAACLLVGHATSEPIDKLPGAENITINFKHYSGYLNASETHFFHYWFVESQGDPTKDPLIFWFNGGPGCSSMEGLLHELGPYNVNPDGKTLHSNPYSWNKMASVVFIESPAGVGYSYSTDGNITTNDDQTAFENYQAVKNFFGQFPQFRKNDVYIMGESYGGIYAPMLTVLMIDGMCHFPVNLKGMALANGQVNEMLNVKTLVQFCYGHGIIGEHMWHFLEDECCHGCIDKCDFTTFTEQCAKTVENIFNFVWGGGLNPYDLYSDCIHSPEHSAARMSAMKAGLFPRMFMARDTPQTERPRNDNGILDSIRHKELYGSLICFNDTDITTYMNDPAVRKAIHIPPGLPKWELCNDKVTEEYEKQYGDMAPFMRKIVDAKVEVLLFYGDTDMACNFLMGQQFAIGLNVTKRYYKSPYRYGDQIAGFKTVYEGMQFVTIKGAGHMAPQMRPAESLYVIQQFLKNKRL